MPNTKQYVEIINFFHNPEGELLLIGNSYLKNNNVLNGYFAKKITTIWPRGYEEYSELKK